MGDPRVNSHELTPVTGLRVPTATTTGTKRLLGMRHEGTYRDHKAATVYRCGGTGGQSKHLGPKK